MTTYRFPEYNPGFLTESELVDAFCVRQLEFESLIDTLRGCTGPANQPQIVIGPRGSGKTTLLLRVAAEAHRDPSLSSQFFPILFAEESYEVSTAGEFWLECLSQLAEQAPARAEGPELSRTVEALRGDMDDRSLADRSLGALLDFADRENKRLVLFVENLNMMFGDMADRDAGWRLRKVLQTEPRIVLIASATNRFAEMDHPDHAFFGMFRVSVLRRLDTDECRALWEKVSGRTVESRTIRSLEILTGGSPRLITIVARFGATRSFRNLMDELLDLVDNHTEYFKSHLESLPPQERRVYVALADLWKPATTREIAKRCRLSTNKCSAQLARLVERGVVDNAGGTVRRKTYYLTERLYNIYYLLRRRRGEAPLVRALINFMQACYPPSEFEAVIAQMRSEMADLEPQMRAIYQTALQELASENGSMDMATASALLNRGHELSQKGQLEDAVDIWAEFVLRFGESDEPEVYEAVAATLNNQGTALGNLNRFTDVLAVSDQLLGRFGDTSDPRLHRQIAGALLNKGAALAALSCFQDALDPWEEILDRFGTSPEPVLLELVAKALVNRATALEQLERREDALAALDTVVDRFAESGQPALLRQAATALVNKGAILRDDNRSEQALEVSREVVHRFGHHDHPELRKQVAMALVNGGFELVELGRSEDALTVWEDVVARYGEATEPDLLESVGIALGNRALVLNVLKRPEQAVVVCDEIASRFGNSKVTTLRTRAVRALMHKGVLLTGLDRPEEALATFDDLACRAAGAKSADTLELKDRALLGKANVQLKVDQHEDAIETIDLLLSGDGQQLQDVLWRAHAIRAKAAVALGDLEGTKRDIEAILTFVASSGSLPSDVLQALMTLSIGIGAEEMIGLIEGSQAEDLLLPFTAALKLELGEQSQVALEVQEVAEDVRRDLEELRKRQEFLDS
ncbi:MAG: ATP-binding protein [Acidobacteria bacterium]|nr:ATP-binding protein [Acidobacteriota bacterium]